ncbi:arrestin domain-containing protein 5-like [Carcharodon carcharias]|uniref:arrestin domain-containing protein 5-like n=1 Tax=Carcharodon carcharias TaxID=13397 RepID=UPI001B7F2088|nr:arrestin domain-containing protein 5-like [Carcharodon carcharias]
MGTVSIFVPIPKVTKLELIFKDQVYLAGETIDGKVVLELNEPLFLYSVKLKISGKGFVEWIGESEENLDYTRKIHCSNREDYFHHIFTLWGADHDAEGLEQALDAGSHVFQFSHKLDNALPSSFSGSHGKIHYYVRAFCTATGGTLAQVEKTLNVQETFNLNLDPSNKMLTVPPTFSISIFETLPFYFPRDSDTICSLYLQLPLLLTAEKEISYWCWKVPGISMNVTVDKSGFVPGEDIIITSEIDNRTVRFLRLISYSIGTEIKYKAFVQEALCDHYREFIEKSELKKMEAMIEAPPRQVTKILGSLQLPKPMFISDMSRCKIISITYQLQVTIPIPAHHISVTASAPIKIGTTPVHISL